MPQKQRPSQPDPNQSDGQKNGSSTTPIASDFLSAPESAETETSTSALPPSLLEMRRSEDGIDGGSVAAPAHNDRFRRHERWSLKAKAMAWALAVSVLPVLIVGSIFYASSQSVSRQINEARQTDATLEETNLALQQQLFLLSLGTGMTTLAAGAIALLGSNRVVGSIQSAAEVSTRMMNQLRRGVKDPLQPKDELKILETHLKIVEEQLPNLLSQQEDLAERSRTFTNISHQIWTALSEEDVLKITVQEVRKALISDRAVIIRFDSQGNGTIIEESAAPGWTKTLSTTIRSFSFGSLEQYRYGRLQVIDNIELVKDNLEQADFSEYQLAVLERLGAKACISAPILQENQLFGLLIVHQCSAPRFWQQPEIDLLAQLTMQVGAALERTKLLQQVDTEANQAQTFINITRRIRESLYEEDILKTTVQEARKALRTDRVIVYSFDEHWYGTVVAESVLPGWPKALQARIKDPCFEHGYVEKYQNGRVNAINNIYEANLTECYLRQLEPFDVKANLVAPILKDERLFGLLIAHQCSWPRNWQQQEIDLFAELATQVGFALDHARLLQKIDIEQGQTQLFSNITRNIRETLKEEDILKTTVQEVRKALRTDRVIVYSFDEHWYGTVVAESVLPGYPKALWAGIKDPCFEEGYVEKYQNGRVNAIDNVYEAGLTPCYLSQLEPFAVKANLVSPILKDERLFGLLIAHQCSGPRHWQQQEIDLFAQLAMQVGFALDHARLLAQVERAYHSAEATSREQRQQKEGLQHQVTELLDKSEVAVEALSNQYFQQMEFVTAAYHQIREVAEAVKAAISSVQQVENHTQQLSQTVQTGQEAIERTVEDMATIHEIALEAGEKSKHLDQPAQRLAKLASLMSNLVSQMKLQATNAALEATRVGSENSEFAAIGQKVTALSRQLEAEITQIKPIISEIQTESTEIAAALKVGAKQAIAGTRSAEETKQKLGQIAAACSQLSLLAQSITEAVNVGAHLSTSAGQSVLGVADVAKQISAQSTSVAEALAKLAAASQEL